MPSPTATTLLSVCPTFCATMTPIRPSARWLASQRNGRSHSTAAAWHHTVRWLSPPKRRSGVRRHALRTARPRLARVPRIRMYCACGAGDTLEIRWRYAGDTLEIGGPAPAPAVHTAREGLTRVSHAQCRPTRIARAQCRPTRVSHAQCGPTRIARAYSRPVRTVGRRQDIHVNLGCGLDA